MARIGQRISIGSVFSYRPALWKRFHLASHFSEVAEFGQFRTPQIRKGHKEMPWDIREVMGWGRRAFDLNRLEPRTFALAATDVVLVQAARSRTQLND
jgi:hypothetical protein